MQLIGVINRKGSTVIVEIKNCLPYNTDQLVPVVDDCASNWELVSFQRDDEGGLMMIEFKRPFGTNDPQDTAIFEDVSTMVPAYRVIAASATTV